jgi:Winged helix DNA-binding domain
VVNGHDLLTQRRLQRAVLARQHLLQRAPAAAGVVTIVNDVCGLQTQYAPTAYVGLWSRLAGFERDDLTTALEQRSVVQATLVRNTIHVVAATAYWPHRIAVREVMQRWFLAQTGTPTEATMRAAADRVREALAGGAEVTRTELDKLASTAGGSYVGMWVDLVRVPPSGTWERRRADRYALADEWIGAAPQLSVDEARDHLVRGYLKGFGPASVKEIASFCAMNVGDIRSAAERVAERRFRAEDGTTLLDLDRLPLPDEGAASPVRFLGTWEAILLAHARRALVIREEDRSRIFGTRMPQSLPTFLVDGQVAGTWRYVNGTVEVDPWREISARRLRQVDGEAAALGVFHR